MCVGHVNGVMGKDFAEIVATKQQCKAESVQLEAKELFGPFIGMATSINCQADGAKLHEFDWKPQYTWLVYGCLASKMRSDWKHMYLFVVLLALTANGQVLC